MIDSFVLSTHSVFVNNEEAIFIDRMEEGDGQLMTRLLLECDLLSLIEKSIVSIAAGDKFSEYPQSISDT